ncbi:hypothetical protein ACQPX6_24735 [Actinomycetospora sp. CA-101289]|uniref:hypothetical protein n=1 Tax=Actinomycetospora sp. CA-101289 TaxID=3239893 RepID=UPI003D96290D
MAVPPRPALAGSSVALAAVPTPRRAPSPRAHLDDLPESEVRDDLAGAAWIVREVTHVPGVLRLRRGRLSFESTRGVLFDGTPADLDLEVGRSSRAGVRVTVGAERLSVRVVRPSGGVAPCRELVERAVAGHLGTDGENDAWTVWRTRLAPARAGVARSRTRVRRFTARGFGAVAPSP